MPGKATYMFEDTSQTPCRRCNDQAILQARSENFCRQCFITYVRSKVVKKMDSFRVRNNKSDDRRRLLLALSLGVSSLSLLHILDQHIDRQISRTGRPGFSLHIVFINNSTEHLECSDLSSLKDIYNRHEYSVLDFDATVTQLAGDAAAGMEYREIETNPSPSSRADMAYIMRTNVIADHAIRQNCECVLWGHTTTALAEKVLAETSKGRGFSLPWTVNDGLSPLGVNFLFPLRDLLKKEINLYANLVDLPKIRLGAEASSNPPRISSKAVTIDSLMQDYFRSVEENYPSIVTNVVRTSAKLTSNRRERALVCKACRMPLENERANLAEWADNQLEDPPARASVQEELCYGCSRSMRGSSSAL